MQDANGLPLELSRTWQSQPLIHELFEAQAARTPLSIALACEQQIVTYAELNARANQLARYLVSLGVGPDELVALCLDRGLDLIVAMLGALKAGGAYVPLDCAYPADRLAYMLEHSAPRVVLSQEKLRAALPETNARIICIDTEWTHIASHASSNPEAAALGLQARNLAYVIYTSGSTGKPKGVMVEHAGVTNFLTSMRKVPGIRATDRMLAVTTVSFDIAALEIYLPLISGAQLVLASRQVAANADLLMSLIDSQDISVLQATPATWQLLVGAGWGGRADLKALCGGEALTHSLADKLRERVGEVWNLYGPTETTIWSCVQAVDGKTRISTGIQPIGRPIANTSVHILDARLQPVARGSIGEIYIGGAGVARGYLQRCDLTVDRFVADPFNAQPEARLYKTGDLGRWAADGTLEYLGRNDQQIKLRGYRIELAEIEAQLVGHAQVKEAAVLAREEVPGDKRLVAYLVGDREAALNAAEAPDVLRQGLVSRWEALWSQTYGGVATSGPSFVSWTSSYTGQPIPREQMQEWLTHTVERIAALGPRKALEIGCGMGLVLQHIAPLCQVYVGTDFSELEPLRAWVRSRKDLQHVELLRRSATELNDLPGGSFDTIILNSVVQYFPDIDYLLTVIRDAIRLLAPGGAIFIGDVRHRGLLATFHSSVQWSKAGSTLSAGELRRRVAHAIAREKELAVDPDFFAALPDTLSGIAAVEIQLKRGRAINELTRYRYDVVLRTGLRAVESAQCEPHSWSDADDLATELQMVLNESRPTVVRWSGIINARLMSERATQKLIDTSDAALTVADLRRLDGGAHAGGIDPELCWTIGAAAGYTTYVDWSFTEQPESFNVTFVDQTRAKVIPSDLIARPPRRPWRSYATDPLENAFREDLIPRLRAYLLARLPEYMVPSDWVMLGELPRTPNGKIDRRALPAPEIRVAESARYVAPLSGTEDRLAQIWAELLRVDRVGRHDNFFELGGHSLVIVQMLERLRAVGLGVTPGAVYANATVAGLAAALNHTDAYELDIPPNAIPQNCERITPEMLPLVELTPIHIASLATLVPGGMANIQDIYPLTPLQEGILFHHLLTEHEGDTYILPILLSFASREKLDAFIAALQAVIDRHDILRTAVLWEQLPRAVQVVYRRAALPVLTRPPLKDRDPVEALKELMSPLQPGLDLNRAPLMELHIADEGGGRRWHALLRVHHLAHDHESIHALLAETTALMQGRYSELSDPVPFRAHVARAMVRLQTSGAEGFFKEKLADVDEPTLCFGLREVYGDGSQIVTDRLSLDSALAGDLRAHARRLRVSVATLFHAAWALVVSHSSGRDDVVFGTLLSGRLDGSEALGVLINTLPLRTRLRGLTTLTLVAATQQALAELLMFEQASLAAAQRCSGVVASTPLFNSILNYLHSNGDITFPTAPGVEVLAIEEWTNYPCSIAVEDRGGGFLLTAHTDQRVGRGRVLSYLVNALRSLVSALEQAPETPALSLSVLPEIEWRRLVTSFNATGAPFPRESLIHELFEAQVARAPGELAVIHEGDTLTYAELNERANQLAGYLSARGVGPDQLVGLCVERGLEMVIGMLAIWKAGGAYVPLDPDYPMERLAYILHDCAPRVILTQARLRDRFADEGMRAICLDRDWADIAGARPLEPIASSVKANHLAYVIHTSGSTGHPKGVMVEHRNVLSLWQGLERIYNESAPCRRVAVNASFNFDGSVKQFVQLLSGRTLVLIPQDIRRDALLLTRFVAEQRVQAIDCTPSQLKAWIAAGLLESRAAELRLVLIGGEPIDSELWNTLARRPESFYNVYGPTESTVDATAARIGPDSPIPHIGKPMENRMVRILDGHRRVMPLGVAGEIYIGGAGVARGYLNRPDLTGERFITLEPNSAERWYRTGDLGRWRPDGTIEYLGRNDQQVKVRGYRIELGEIESKLLQHPHVEQAAVDVRNDGRLVAYVVGPARPDELLTHLKSLPSYMIPSAWVALDALPLTPNGKLDRRALPEPQHSSAPDGSYVAPRTDLEHTIAEIWAEVLRLEQVGLRDHFFELGGHSLLAMQVMVRIRSAIALEVPVRALFHYPTVEQLAAHIEALEMEDMISQVAAMSDSEARGIIDTLKREARA